MSENKFIFRDIDPKDKNKFVLYRDGNKYKTVKFEQSENAVTEGTLLNAEKLNSILDNKQDVLQAGRGISISDNGGISADVLDRTYNDFIPRTNVPSYITSNVEYVLNKPKWEMKTDFPSSYDYGRHYLASFADKIYCGSVEFEANIVRYSIDTDADPTVAIKFRGNTNASTVYCLFHIVKKRVRMVRATDWSVVGTTSNNVLPEVAIGDSLKVKVVRGDYLNGYYTYTFYFNGQKVHSVRTNECEPLPFVDFGTIGCKALSLKNWKISKLKNKDEVITQAGSYANSITFSTDDRGTAGIDLPYPDGLDYYEGGYKIKAKLELSNCTWVADEPLVDGGTLLFNVLEGNNNLLMGVYMGSKISLSFTVPSLTWSGGILHYTFYKTN